MGEGASSAAVEHPGLVELPGRPALLAALARALEGGRAVAVLVVDLDHFSTVTDSLGYDVADRLLGALGRRLVDLAGPEGFVACDRGDTFALCVPTADLQRAQQLAETVLHAVKRPLGVPEQRDVRLAASVGAALALPGARPERALLDADTAMNAAKRSGGGCVRCFAPDLRAAVEREHLLAVDLHTALTGAVGLALAYQPQVDVNSGAVIGYEALLRWQHPVLGELSPLEVVEIAERDDLIHDLGRWVLEKSLRDAAGWEAADPHAGPRVGVNVSVRQLLDPTFPGDVEALLAASGLLPHRLCLEVTETALVRDTDLLVAGLRALRTVGVKLSIDDFGTGHASLAYLSRFPVDEIKIDKSFVDGLGHDAGSAAIVSGVLAMARTFDLQIVAEGVEEPRQLALLRELGVDVAQGYALGPPASSVPTPAPLPDDALAVLRAPTLPSPRGSQELAPELRSARERWLGHVEAVAAVCRHPQELLDAVLDLLSARMSVHGGTVAILEDGFLRSVALQPAPSPGILAFTLAQRIRLGQGVSGSICLTGRPRYLPDTTIASTVVPRDVEGWLAELQVRSWYGVPLAVSGVIIGLFQVESRVVDAYDEQARADVLAVAPLLARAVAGMGRSQSWDIRFASSAE